jgi:hypothetical protein
MNRQLYQMGGIGTLPMDFGQPLQVPQQQQPSFSSAQNITMNPLLNYGQPQLGGSTPLTMAGGGISRLGYQEGGMGMEMMQPQMQDPMMQEQMMQPPMQDQMQAPMQGQMMQGAGDEEQGQTALLTIVQLLIEQGIDPETARELAMQILQAFAQGGAPAVEEFANQLEQEEMQQEPMMMAGGGIITIRQGAKFGKIFKSAAKAVSGVVKGVASAVKSIAQSPIGMIALSIAAPYALGALTGGAFATFGGTGFAGAALRAGISNLAIQGITTGKINPKQALMAAAGGALAQGVFGPAGGVDAAAARDAMNAGDYMQYGSSVQEGLGTSIPLKSGVIPSDIGSYDQSVQKMYDTSMITPSDSDILSNVKASSLANTQGQTMQQLGEVKPMTTFEKGISGLQDFGNRLVSDPMGTLQTGIGSIYDTATQTIKDNPYLSVGGAFLAGQQFRAPLPGEDPNEYNKLKAAHDAEVAGYVTQYGRGAKVFSPGEFGLYAREKTIDPFAGLTTYAANGGRIGYAEGSTSFERQTLEKKGYSDMMKNMTPREISQLYDSVMGTFSRRFQAEGSMPMGEPRRNPAGIMELDYRAKGGFVPPIGIKEKEDDIPAMLSNNEFVFTADAVRAAGGGSVNKGAQRMYGLMKQLESRIA